MSFSALIPSTFHPSPTLTCCALRPGKLDIKHNSESSVVSFAKDRFWKRASESRVFKLCDIVTWCIWCSKDVELHVVFRGDDRSTFFCLLGFVLAFGYASIQQCCSPKGVLSEEVLRWKSSNITVDSWMAYHPTFSYHPFMNYGEAHPNSADLGVCWNSLCIAFCVSQVARYMGLIYEMIWNPWNLVSSKHPSEVKMIPVSPANRKCVLLANWFPKPGKI